MKVEFFIDRPIFSAVLSILIVVVGCIGLYLLPVDQYPQITPPMVKISASYPGASAQTVSQAVATPIEQELNGTPGMLYMESSSSNSGGLSINVTFDISANPELSAVEPGETGRVALARRGGAERYFRRKAIFESAHDPDPDFRRSPFRRNLPQ